MHIRSVAYSHITTVADLSISGHKNQYLLLKLKPPSLLLQFEFTKNNYQLLQMILSRLWIWVWNQTCKFIVIQNKIFKLTNNCHAYFPTKSLCQLGLIIIRSFRSVLSGPNLADMVEIWQTVLMLLVLLFSWIVNNIPSIGSQRDPTSLFKELGLEKRMELWTHTSTFF